VLGEELSKHTGYNGIVEIFDIMQIPYNQSDLEHVSWHKKSSTSPAHRRV